MTMASIQITLPDGAKREVARGTTPAEIARKISHGLAREALVARVDGELIDLSRPLEENASLKILTSKDPETLQVFRHSAAHLLAAAVIELFPDVKLGIGPPIDNGFFYEFLRERALHAGRPRNASRKRCTSSRRTTCPTSARSFPRRKRIELYKNSNQGFKCELVEEKAIEPMVSFYTTGKFIDFCRGPHIPSTGRIRAFKLMNVAGAYWKGQEGNPQMQRIYARLLFHSDGTRRISAPPGRGQTPRSPPARRTELDLFSIQEEAGPGLIFWHPKGGLIRKLIEDWLRDELLRRGYELVFTPHIMRLDLWKTSGHTDFYRDNMFGPIEVEKADYQLKPMNCPGHILIYKSQHAQLSRFAACAWPNLAPSIATNAAAFCTASCACAASRRTTRTFSACLRKSNPKSRPASISHSP